MFLINSAHFDVSKTYKILGKHFKFFIGLETFSIVSYPIGDTSPRDFSIMTLVVYNINFTFPDPDPLKPGRLVTYEPVSPVWRKSNGFLLLGPLATGCRTSFWLVE